MQEDLDVGQRDDVIIVQTYFNNSLARYYQNQAII
jgi:hypothetical protein